MTEDEAKTKWCPMVRFDNGPEGLGINRVIDSGSTPQTQIYCIASECMWWVHEKSAWCHPDGTEPTKEELHEHLTPEKAGLITLKFGHCGAIK